MAPFPSSLRIFDMSDRDQLFSAPIAKLGDWTFDERVAEVFP
ncbi:MAG: carboxy-S-adenosyl-L-methionine synthase CmoA, partial [Pantoea agglomerans]